MSTSSKPKQTQAFFATFITCFLLLLNHVKSSDRLVFGFNKFQPDQGDIIFQSSATVSQAGVLRLTEVKDRKPVGGSIGRALYAAPVHIWDSLTGRVASFSTSFSFVIKELDESLYPADGLAFFLAPRNYPLGAIGGELGLFDNDNYNASRQVVAVEFDTYHNYYDPSDRHIGIDVNSIQSIQTAPWDWRDGGLANVVINYHAFQKTLNVSLSYPTTEKTIYVSASVDLKKILPEWVTIGFSGATGINIQTNDIHMWYFTSTMETNSLAGLENNVP